jgi:YHS domain-containing protein
MLVRLLIWLIVGALVYTVYQMLKQALLKPSPPSAKSSRGEEMVRDPECGTYVPRIDAVHAEVGGKPCYFCSAECRDKYLHRS